MKKPYYNNNKNMERDAEAISHNLPLVYQCPASLWTTGTTRFYCWACPYMAWNVLEVNSDQMCSLCTLPTSPASLNLWRKLTPYLPDQVQHLN